MVDKINEVFTAVQQLQIQPTLHNVTILKGVMDGLREIAAMVVERGGGYGAGEDPGTDSGEEESHV